MPRGAEAAGREVRRIEVAKLDFPLLRSAEEFYRGAVPDAISPAQEAIRWADHLLILYPLWHGHFPALFHAFLEQTFRPGFAAEAGAGRMPKKLLGGRSARIVVTMGMPGFFYRWYFGAHSLKSLERSILRFSGIRPVRTTLIGWVGAGSEAGREPSSPEHGSSGAMDAQRRARWLDRLRTLGREGR
jgi:putative NADPH-quinone reductase